MKKRKERVKKHSKQSSNKSLAAKTPPPATLPTNKKNKNINFVNQTKEINKNTQKKAETTSNNKHKYKYKKHNKKLSKNLLTARAIRLPTFVQKTRKNVKKKIIQFKKNKHRTLVHRKKSRNQR